MTPDVRDEYLRECRALVVERMHALVGGRPDGLASEMLEYPLRAAKGLRPALCIATCRALGGGLAEAIPTATALELYHNAFLIHDDVEDGSELRRDRRALHHEIGQAAAINVGDAMLATALRPLLDNLELLDVGRALRILEHVAEMARLTADGQALELEWIRARRWDVQPRDYVAMVTKKTAFYTFVAPIVCGGIIARASSDWLREARAFAIDLGVAFQIRDDLLNLEGDPSVVGKESCGDLWEGKRTLVLGTLFADGGEARTKRAREILDKPRPVERSQHHEDLSRALEVLVAEGALSAAQASEVACVTRQLSVERHKTSAEIVELRAMLDEVDALRAAHVVADGYASSAAARWEQLRPATSTGVHRDLIESLIHFVTERAR